CGLPLCILQARAAPTAVPGRAGPWAEARRSVWVPPVAGSWPDDRADISWTQPARAGGVLRNVSAAIRRRRVPLCARAAAATQPAGRELAIWLLLLIMTSTCMHVRNRGK